MACPIVFILFNKQCWQWGVYKVMKNDHFLKFLVVWIIFPKFLGKLRSSLYYNCVKWWVLHAHAFPIVSILFYVCDWQGGVLKVIRNDFKKSFYKYFYQLGLFPQVFSQVNEWPILELYEMIRVSHVVVCPVVFILFDDRCLQGGVLKIMKNDHFF